jgi:putative PIN family toxin of toxin-antitoxin system
MRAVIDTGVLISGLLNRWGTPGEILRALRENRFNIIYSVDILIELIDVLSRPTFHKKYHLLPDDISALINLIRLRGELISPGQPVTACRDPKDDKFLAAAITGNADWIVSGDADLLELIVFDGIPIISPINFLERLSTS